MLPSLTLSPLFDLQCTRRQTNFPTSHYFPACCCTCRVVTYNFRVTFRLIFRQGSRWLTAIVQKPFVCNSSEAFKISQIRWRNVNPVLLSGIYLGLVLSCRHLVSPTSNGLLTRCRHPPGHRHFVVAVSNCKNLSTSEYPFFILRHNQSADQSFAPVSLTSCPVGVCNVFGSDALWVVARDANLNPNIQRNIRHTFTCR